MSNGEAQVKLKKMRLFLEQLERDIKACQIILRGEVEA